MDKEEITGKISEYLPLINEFVDKDLASKVANVWYHLWQESLWEKLEEALWNPVCPGITLIDHTTIVAKTAMHYALLRNEMFRDNVNLDILLAGALLHDVSRLIEVKPYGKSCSETEKGKLFQHAFLGAHKAMIENLPNDVIHIIISHTGKSRVIPQTAEAVIVYAVDIADADTQRIKIGEKLLISKHK